MIDPRDDLINHVPALRAFAVSLTRDASSADDLVQETLMKAWEKIDKFEPGTNLRAWLFTILRNTFYSLRRKRKREIEDVGGAFSATLVSKPSHDGVLQLRDFMVVFNQLPDKQREVLVLVGVQGLSYDEVATMCGVKIGTVKSRLNRARQTLADRLGIDKGDALELTDAVTAGIVSNQTMLA